MKSLVLSLRIGLVILGSVILWGCATSPLVKPSSGRGELRGMVYDLERQPVSDTTIELTIDGKATLRITDLHGRFGFAETPFGIVSVRIAKPGYEPFVWEFRYNDAAQVLYIQLASADQLLEAAAQSLEQRNWLEFDDFLARARAAGPQNQQTLVLEATGLERRGRLQEALKLLLDTEPPQPSLAWELLTAQIAHRLGQRDTAVEHWQRALAIREDPRVRALISGL